MTLYTPHHYAQHDSALIFEIIKTYGFATVVTQGSDGPSISHLPLILDSFEGRQTLIGHCARANPQWKQFAQGQMLTAVFHGPQSYISPAWYEPEPDNVPTWNYATVHVRGTATIIDDAGGAYDLLQKTVRHFEADLQTGWTLPETPNRDLLNLINGIVAFRIEIQDIQAKFKLSQKQTATDRATVARELAKLGEERSKLAALMNRNST